MKQCLCCKITKPTSEFHKCKSRKDGLYAYCKVCKKDKDHKDYTNHRDNRLKNQAEYSKTDAGKETSKKAQIAYRAKNKDRHSIYERLRSAIKRGSVIKPNVCELCGSTEDKDKIHGHHWDYSKENWLNVIWCCSKCHNDIHNDKPHYIMNRQNMVILNHISLE